MTYNVYTAMVGGSLQTLMLWAQEEDNPADWFPQGATEIKCHGKVTIKGVGPCASAVESAVPDVMGPC